MRDPFSSQHAADVLSRLFTLFRESRYEDRHRPGPDTVNLSPNLLMNLRQFGSVPSVRQLHALSLHLSWSIGGVYRLFGYRLDSMRSVEELLNGARTRFIESYPFHRDRPVDLPAAFGEHGAFQRTAFLSELVMSWRKGTPIRAIRGPHWQRDGILYAQIGTRDALAAPKVPPGSYIAVRPISEHERRNPNPERFYFLQHGSGYLCCACVAHRGRLSVITHGDSYPGPHEFFYPGQIRIVGRVIFFASRLPASAAAVDLPHRGHRPAALMLPWEHRSLPALISTERLRFGITEAQLEEASEILEAQLGAGISARTLRRYEREVGSVPRTPVLLALTLIHSLRFTDVLRLLNLWADESAYYSFAMLMKAKAWADLPLVFQPAETPSPLAQWQSWLDEWGEWPTLLSMAIPDLEQWGRRILRIDQSAWFRGLDPLIEPHSIVVLDEHDTALPTRVDRNKQNWERPIYALRHEGRVICGYLEADGTYFVVVPHPSASTTPRLAFRRNQAQILGRVVGAATPL